jgi:hypothetical protein
MTSPQPPARARISCSQARGASARRRWPYTTSTIANHVVCYRFFLLQKLVIMQGYQIFGRRCMKAAHKNGVVSLFP